MPKLIQKQIRTVKEDIDWLKSQVLQRGYVSAESIFEKQDEFEDLVEEVGLKKKGILTDEELLEGKLDFLNFIKGTGWLSYQLQKGKEDFIVMNIGLMGFERKMSAKDFEEVKSKKQRIKFKEKKGIKIGKLEIPYSGYNKTNVWYRLVEEPEDTRTNLRKMHTMVSMQMHVLKTKFNKRDIIELMDELKVQKECLSSMMGDLRHLVKNVNIFERLNAIVKKFEKFKNIAEKLIIKRKKKASLFELMKRRKKYEDEKNGLIETLKQRFDILKRSIEREKGWTNLIATDLNKESIFTEQLVELSERIMKKFFPKAPKKIVHKVPEKKIKEYKKELPEILQHHKRIKIHK